MRKFVLSIFCSLLSVFGYAQQDTEFWFAPPYINCDHGAVSPYRLVIFAFEEDASVIISMPANPEFTPITVQVAANDHANIILAYDKWEGDEILTTPFNQKSNRGLLITSTSKIECYYQIEGDNSEAFTLKGQNALGTDFLVAGQKFYDTAIDYYPTARSSAHIVATKDNTIVEITPSCPIYIDDETYTQETFIITLNRGEVYSLAAYYPTAAQNVMGTRIKANAPIAVTSNDDSVTADNSQIDDIGEQLLPVNFAGTEFMVISTGNDYALCTVFALEDNTEISTSNGDIITINQSEYINIPMHYIDAMSITASKPIIVFQIMAAMDGGAELGGTILPHAECTGSSKAGYMPFSGYSVYITLMTRKSNIESFSINGTQIDASHFYPIDSSEHYYYARLLWSDSYTPFVVECTTGIFQMGIIEGSYGSSNTYGFFSDYAEQIPMRVDANGDQVYSKYYIGPLESLKLFAYSVEGFEVTDVVWTLPNGSTIYGDNIVINEVTPEYLGEYVVTANTAMCGVMSHRFNVLYHPEVTIEASFCEGSVYTWENHYEEDGVTLMTFTEAGIYTDTLVTSDGVDSVCVLQLTEVSLPTLTVRPDTTIHMGEKVLLWATGADYIEWSPAEYIIETSELTYMAVPLVTTEYTAIGYNAITTSGANLVYNGNFDLGNVGFYTDCNYFNPYTSPGSYGTYTIADDVQGFWYGHVESVKAYGGSGNMMILDGKTTAHSIVWQQKVSVKPNTFYAFSAQVMSALDSYYEGQFALLQFNVNNQDVGAVFHSPDVLYTWEKFYNIWYSGNDTTALLTVFNQNDNYMGNDFAIDEISFEELHAECKALDTVTITVINPSLTDTTICSSELPFVWHDLTIDSAGVYQTNIMSAFGTMDSAVILNLKVTETVFTTLHYTICYGESYTWNGVTYTNSGEYTITLQAVNGCDSVVVLDLTVLPEIPETVIYETTCFDVPYVWSADGNTYTSSTSTSVTLTSIHGCDSVVTLHLTVLPKVSIIEEWAEICDGESYTWYGNTYTKSGDYKTSYTNEYGCTGEIILHLTVWPKSPAIEEWATITNGDTYTWNGGNYDTEGTYTLSTYDEHGCPQDMILHLDVQTLDFTVNVADHCANDPYIDFDIQSDMIMDKLHFQFGSSSQWRDTVVYTPGQYVSIPNNARAGVYNVVISAYAEGRYLGTKTQEYTLLYPSSVLDQHWDDFIGVLTHDYNGGYDFVSFQWYKDNEPIPGENRSYIATPLEMGASYSAMLEDAIGLKLMTCPIVATHQEELSLYPSLLSPRQTIHVYTTQSAIIQLYTITGELLYSTYQEPGEILLQAPDRTGLYIVQIMYHDNTNRVLTRKITVR